MKFVGCVCSVDSQHFLVAATGDSTCIRFELTDFNIISLYRDLSEIICNELVKERLDGLHQTSRRDHRTAGKQGTSTKVEKTSM